MAPSLIPSASFHPISVSDFLPLLCSDLGGVGSDSCCPTLLSVAYMRLQRGE